MKKKESILKRADEIIHNRSEEKERKYAITNDIATATEIKLTKIKNSWDDKSYRYG